MTATEPMLDSHPTDATIDPRVIAAAIDALADCAVICEQCADACMDEAEADQLRACIRLDLACADICHATAGVVARYAGIDPDLTRSLVDACVIACRLCAEECAMHAGTMRHCAICSEQTRRCAAACLDLLDAMS
ncbi:MAG: hypothetical protein R2699_02345 [Acidimicrobiales bacterium]|nr:hypothetical protein [Acidimicrobiales bacterium]